LHIETWVADLLILVEEHLRTLGSLLTTSTSSRSVTSWSTFVTLRPLFCNSPRITESLLHFSCLALPSALSLGTSFHLTRPGNSMTSQMRPKMTRISAKMASSSNHQPCHMFSALSQRLDQPVSKTISPKLVLMQRSTALSVFSDHVSSELPQYLSTFCSLVWALVIMITIIAHYHFSVPV